MLNKVRNIIHYRYTPAQLLNYLKYKTNRRKNTVLNYRPLWMLVYVTDLCNLHCKMCPHHTNADSSSFTQAKKLNADYISLETLEFSFKKFPECYFVMLAGVGEPLLHPQFKDIIRLCEKYKKKVKIVTNGIKLTTDMSDFLSLSKCIDEIQISLNAPDHITYFDICQGSEREYITVVNNIRGLVLAKAKNNSSVRISTSAVCGNEFKGKAYDFLCFADSLGVDRIELFRYIDCNGVQREHNKKLNNGLPILHKVPPKRDYGRYFCIMAEKGGTSHGGLTEKLSPFFHAKKQEVNAYGR